VKRPEFDIQIKSQDDGSMLIQGSVRFSPTRDEIPESFKDLTPEERNRALEAYLRRMDDAEQRTNVLIQGLAVVAQSTLQRRRNEPVPDNVVRGPWGKPGEPACTHPGCVFIVTHSFGGYPLCTKHYSEAYDTFVREEEQDQERAAERAAREHAEEHAPDGEEDEPLEDDEDDEERDPS
jgi:hypothetical protein